MTFLGIDVGTSAVKALLLEETGSVAAHTSAPLSLSHPQPLWSEQAPDDWWQAVDQAVLDLPAPLRRRVTAIGLSGQMHGATVLDDADQPLRPAILWNDGRSAAQCLQFERRFPAARQVTGNCAMPGFTAPKLLWLAEHEPECFARIRKVLLPKDYVRLHMTGEHATDCSDAAGTLWVDVQARRWSEAALAATGLTLAHMPRLLEGSEVSGQLRGSVAARWGMDRVPVAAGGGDNAASAVGCGITRDHQGFLSLGTSGVLFLAGERFLPNPARGVHAFCHALPGLWHQMSVTLSAASCLDWLAAIVGEPDVGAFLVAAEADAVQREHRHQLVFLPYLSGERTPHNNPRAKGVLFGLDPTVDRNVMLQAVLEGVAFAFADGQQALLDTGAEIDRLDVIGGGARSRWWGRLLATALDRPLCYASHSEHAAALGAARLAWLCLGAAQADICATPPVIAEVQPDAALAPGLAERQERFRALYPTLKDLWSSDDPVQ